MIITPELESKFPKPLSIYTKTLIERDVVVFDKDFFGNVSYIEFKLPKLQEKVKTETFHKIFFYVLEHTKENIKQIKDPVNYFIKSVENTINNKDKVAQIEGQEIDWSK